MPSSATLAAGSLSVAINPEFHRITKDNLVYVFYANKALLQVEKEKH